MLAPHDEWARGRYG